MKKSLAILLLLAGLPAFAGISTITFTIVNNANANFPGGTSLVTATCHSSYAPNGWVGVFNYYPNIPPLAPGASATVTTDVSSIGNNYPTCDWVQFTLACGAQSGQMPVSQSGYNAPATVVNTVALNYSSCTVGAQAPTIYTNYTFTIRNDMAGLGDAVWTFNGTVVQEMDLLPGQSGSWTTPSIEVSPVPQNFTVNTSIKLIDQSLIYTNGGWQFGSDGSGNNLTFTNGGGTLGGYTNGNGGFFQAQTNQPIVWQPSAGAASETTLKGGFEDLHNQEQNVVNGLSVLHNDLANTIHGDLTTLNSSIRSQSNLLSLSITNNAGGSTNIDYTPYWTGATNLLGNLNQKFGQFTNDSGQLVQYVAILTNDLWTIIRAQTNNLNTNNVQDALVAGKLDNLTNTIQTLTNLVAAVNSNAPSLYGAFSNALDQMIMSTNADIATEATQIGISNLLGNGFAGLSNALSHLSFSNNVVAGTNPPPWTNGLTLEQYTNYLNPAAIQTNLLGQLPAQTANTNAAQALADTSGIKNLANNMPAVGIDSGGSASPQNINLGHGIVIAMGAGIPSPFNAIRGLIAWCIIIVLIFSNYKTSIDACSAVLQTPQATTAGEEVLGNNVNAASAIAMGLLIVATASGVPAIAVGFMANELALVSTANPLSFLESALGWGYSFLSQYIPIYTLGTAVCSRFAFYVIVRGVALIAAGVVKLLTGI